MKSLVVPKLILLLLIASGWATAAQAVSFSAIRNNNAGIKELKAKQPYLAYKSFLHGLSSAPFNPALHMNLGLAFAGNKEWEKARLEFQTASRYSGPNKDLKFMALFNAGAAAGQQGDIDAALDFYQQALEFKPNSREAKTNIELLLKGQAQKNGDNKKGNNNKNKKNGGQKQNKGQSKDDKGNQNKDKRNPNGPIVNGQKQEPRPFESHQLTKNDVRKILEEIKRQEQKIRAKVNDRAIKDKPPAKDW